MPKQESPSGEQQEEEEDEEDGLDPAAAAKKAKQLARKGITFSAKESPKVRHLPASCELSVSAFFAKESFRVR